MEPGEEGTITIPVGTTVQSRRSTYELTQNLQINYLNWEGAFAGLYASTEIRPGRMIVSRGPILPEQEDVNQTAYNIVRKITYSHQDILLKRKDATPEEQEDKNTIETLFDIQRQRKKN